jgi:hypothetical protein
MPCLTDIVSDLRKMASVLLQDHASMMITRIDNIVKSRKGKTESNLHRTVTLTLILIKTIH